MKLRKAYFGTRRVTALFLGCLKFLAQVWAGAVRLLARALPVLSPADPGAELESLPFREKGKAEASPTLARDMAWDASVGSEAAARPPDSAAAIADDKPLTRHLAPAETVFLAEGFHDGRIDAAQEADGRIGAALPIGTENGLAYGAPDPDSQQGIALPVEIDNTSSAPAGHLPLEGEALEVRQGLALPYAQEAVLAGGHGADALGVDWGIRLTSVWKDIYINPYYDYFAIADEMAAEYDGTSLYRTLIKYDDPPNAGREGNNATRTFLWYTNYRGWYELFRVESFRLKPDGSGTEIQVHLAIRMDTREIIMDTGDGPWNEIARAEGLGGVILLDNNAEDFFAFDPAYWEEWRK